MLTVLRQRNFGLLWLAGLISLLGDWALYAVFPFYIAKITGSALATGGIALIELLPNLVLGVVVGVFIDRWDPRKTMIVTDLLRGLILVPLLLVHSAAFLWLIYVVAFTESSISVFFGPAKFVLITRVVRDEDLVVANSLNSISDNACRLAGPIIGGGLFLLLGLNLLVLVDILSYALSALLTLGIVVAGTLPHLVDQAKAPTAQETKEKFTPLAFCQQWLQGMQLMYQEKGLMTLCLCMAAAMLGQGIFNALLAIFGEQVVHMNTEIYGWYLSVQGIGGLIGGFIVGKVGKTLRPTWLLTSSLMGSGLLLLLQFNFPLIPIALATSLLAGIFVVGWIVSLQSILQRSLDPTYLGRIISTYGTVQITALLIGTSGGSLLGQIWGIVPVLNLAAVFLLLASIGSLLWLRDFKPQKVEVNTAVLVESESV